MILAFCNSVIFVSFKVLHGTYSDMETKETDFAVIYFTIAIVVTVKNLHKGS